MLLNFNAIQPIIHLKNNINFPLNRFCSDADFENIPEFRFFPE